MRRAIRLACRGEGRAAPNPLVGAVVAREGRVVGEGYHVFEKQDHAEVVALRDAGAQSDGATLYVTLEPCAHFGRTPPCVERIVESGVRQIFMAVSDPNPDVTGGGRERLLSQGIMVHEGLCREQAVALNEPYFYFAEHQRPFIHLKLALTLDGMIATRSGDSKWITGERAARGPTSSLPSRRRIGGGEHGTQGRSFTGCEVAQGKPDHESSPGFAAPNVSGCSTL